MKLAKGCRWGVVRPPALLALTERGGAGRLSPGVETGLLGLRSLALDEGLAWLVPVNSMGLVP